MKILNTGPSPETVLSLKGARTAAQAAVAARVPSTPAVLVAMAVVPTQMMGMKVKKEKGGCVGFDAAPLGCVSPLE